MTIKQMYPRGKERSRAFTDLSKSEELQKGIFIPEVADGYMIQTEWKWLKENTINFKKQLATQKSSKDAIPDWVVLMRFCFFYIGFTSETGL